MNDVSRFTTTGNVMNISVLFHYNNLLRGRRKRKRQLQKDAQNIQKGQHFGIS